MSKTKTNFELDAFSREDLGKGASRRLRRNTGKIPAIIYGGHEDPKPISLNKNEIAKVTQHEAFYSQILTIKLDGKAQKAVVKDIQRHPYKAEVTHMDFQRISAKEHITMRVPLHFLNEDKAPGVKLQEGIISHITTDIEIKCLPQDLPEFIEVDVAELELDQSIHLSQLKIPKGVEFAHPIDEDHDAGVVSIHLPRAVVVEEEEIEAGEEDAEGESGDNEDGKEESSK